MSDHGIGRRVCKFGIKCLLVLGITLVLLSLYMIPPKSPYRSTGIKLYVYKEDEQLNLTLSRAIARSSNQTHINGFPKILHHEFESLDVKPVRPEWKLARQSCIENSPGFTHMLWNITTLRVFLAQHYSWFLSTYDSYKYGIEKLDAGRYFLLYHYGGMYVDMDITCKMPIPMLFRSFPNAARVVLRATKYHDDFANSLMVAQARHEFFYDIIHHLEESKLDSVLPYLSIIFSTGPRYLGNRYYTFLAANQDRVSEGGDPVGGVFVLRWKVYLEMFVDPMSGAWHTWDAKFIHFLDEIIPSFVMNLFV